MKFYKYCSFNSYILSDIKKYKITLSKPRIFNDPFDCLPYWDTSKLRKFSHPKIKSPQDIAFIYSLTTKKDDEEWNPLMWSHYADEHKGFCIEYEINEPNNNNKAFYCSFYGGGVCSSFFIKS